MKIIVTGAAGFVGMHVAERLLARGDTIVGVDNFSAYYDRRLKRLRSDRLKQLSSHFAMEELDIADAEALQRVVRGADAVVHLAAQAGVRYSIDNPFAYERSNLAGHLSVLEACRHAKVRHLVYASSSSVYGERPLEGSGFKETDPAVSPVSLYAATKRSCELMSASYAKLYGFPQSGLRLFTVYGPMGRPDMAYFGFTEKIMRGEPIEVFGEGRMARDFTYVDDVVDGVLGVLDRPPPPGGHEIYNVGDSRPIPLLTMISTLEDLLGRKAKQIMRPMQPGDVPATFADVSKIAGLTGYAPKVLVEEGLARFVAWWREWDKVRSA